MKRLALLVLAAVAGGAQADTAAPFVFNVAGLRATHLLPEVTQVRVYCSVYAPGDSQWVAYGYKVFDVVPLANPGLGRGVESGPFQVSATHVTLPEKIPNVTTWTCQMEVQSQSLNSATTAKSTCTESQLSTLPWSCAKEGQAVEVWRSGRF